MTLWPAFLYDYCRNSLQNIVQIYSTNELPTWSKIFIKKVVLYNRPLYFSRCFNMVLFFQYLTIEFHFTCVVIWPKRCSSSRVVCATALAMAGGGVVHRLLHVASRRDTAWSISHRRFTYSITWLVNTFAAWEMNGDKGHICKIFNKT